MIIDIPLGNETHLRIEWHWSTNIRRVIHGKKAVESFKKLREDLWK